MASHVGLYLYANILFRFMHPALLIPWPNVGQPQRTENLWWTSYEYELDYVTIRVTQRAHAAIEKFRS
jgi:hypothetical protein